MYLYIYIYIYTYTCIYIYIFIYIHTKFHLFDIFDNLQAFVSKMLIYTEDYQKMTQNHMKTIKVLIYSIEHTEHA